MTLPVFTLLAVGIPLILLVLLWAFARSITWAYRRPRTLGGLQVAFGLAYLLVFSFIEPRRGAGLILPILIAAIFIAQGLYNWFRGQPVSLE